MYNLCEKNMFVYMYIFIYVCKKINIYLDLYIYKSEMHYIHLSRSRFVPHPLTYRILTANKNQQAKCLQGGPPDPVMKVFSHNFTYFGAKFSLQTNQPKRPIFFGAKHVPPLFITGSIRGPPLCANKSF